LILSQQGTSLASHTLEQHANRHARWEGVWVDQHIGHHSALGEREILLFHNNTVRVHPSNSSTAKTTTHALKTNKSTSRHWDASSNNEQRSNTLQMQ
jgi:hypothetical protein